MTATLVSALLFGVIALALVIFLLWAISRGISFNLREAPQKLRLKRRTKLLEEIDSYIECSDSQNALERIADAFLLDTGHLSEDAVDRVSHHNMEVLARLVSIAELTGARIPTLAVLEDLLTTRSALLRAIAEARETTKKLTDQSATSGKDIPTWALSEFTKKISELDDRISTNRLSLEGQIREVVVILRRSTITEVSVH